jgi:pimeloyl-[acyl-carrier protein] synthase
MTGDLAERWRALTASAPSSSVSAGAQELFRELRETRPVHHFAASVVVTRYEDVQAVVRDSVRYSAAPENGSLTAQRRSRVHGEDRRAFDELTAFRSLFMAMQDGADHRRVRAVAHRAFTPRRVQALAEAAQRYTDQLVEPLISQGAGDLVDIAYRLPLMIIADLLEVSPTDRDRLYEWSIALVAHAGRADPEPVRAALDSVRSFTEYVESAMEAPSRTTG